jgi:tight adherence protein B
MLALVGLSLEMGRQESVADRLSRFGDRKAPSAVAAQQDRSVSPLARGLNRAIARQSFAASTARQLARADLKLTVSEYTLINLASVLIAFLIGAVLSGSIFFGVAAAVGGFYVPSVYVKFRQRARLAAFNSRLADTITMLANALRSGYSLAQGMDMVARESPPPVSEEFARVVREIGLGLSNQEALANLLRRVPSEDLDLLITSINLQHEVGGNLAQLLDSIGFTIRERVRIKGEIRSLTAQVRYSGYVVAILPIAMAGVLMVIRPDYIGPLFQSLCGWSMVVAAGIFMGTGFLVTRKIADIEV